MNVSCVRAPRQKGRLEMSTLGPCGTRRLIGGGLSLTLAGLAIGFVTAISPGTALAEPCADGMSMNDQGVCAPALVNEASASGGANEATPGPAAQNACGIAQADADANEVGAQTADIPCP